MPRPSNKSAEQKLQVVLSVLRGEQMNHPVFGGGSVP